MMATCFLEKDSSIQAGIQEGSPPRQYELGVTPHFLLPRLVLISSEQLRRKLVHCLVGKG